jgi:hypothetical protein
MILVALAYHTPSAVVAASAAKPWPFVEASRPNVRLECPQVETLGVERLGQIDQTRPEPAASGLGVYMDLVDPTGKKNESGSDDPTYLPLGRPPTALTRRRIATSA